MPKKLEITPKIADLIRTASDGAIDPKDVSVYEVESINELPVNKYGLFDKAVHSVSTLQEMADAVNARPLKTHVPVHWNHDQGYGKPIGKTFHAGVFQVDGIHVLRSLFWLPNTETEAINKVEGGAIEEMSVGTQYKHLNCSACGWDYLGDDATDDNVWELTCGNGHKLGTDGTHLKLNGLARWREQSLVSLGAAQNAKIMSRARALLGADEYNALKASSGRDLTRTILFASATPLPEKDQMDLTELVKELTTVKTNLALKETELAGKVAEIATLKATADKVPALEAQVTTLTKEVETLKATDGAKAQADLKLSMEFVRKEADRLAVALGATPLKADASLTELQASIETNRVSLGDRFKPQPQVVIQKEDDGKVSAFKTR